MSQASLASSALAVPYSRIRELGELAMRMDAAAGENDKVLRLYFGESNIPTPEFIKNAARKAMADGFTFYTENAGLPSTRQALARYYEEIHGVALDYADRIVITTSGVQALNVALRCLLNPGDEAIVLTPAWPNGSSIITMANAAVRQIAQPLAGDRYGIDFDAIEDAINERTRVILYTSPSNPLGWVASSQDQDRLLELTRRHNLWLMADEVYERLYYGGARLGEPVPTILTKASPGDAVIVVQSFSKTWCMTGWRVGWIVSRPDLCEKAAQLNEFIVSHAPSFAQRAAETALLCGEQPLREMLVRLKENRDFCIAELAKLPGVTVPRPEGAFYLFPKIDGLADSFDFCKRLLLETKLGLAPGVAFGAGGEGSVRICYAAERPILEKAMERLRRFLQS
ncbi:MAG: putative N-acetyl-LL-diaminopimelate aminotransferase [Bryobacteraceae bacterium]|nr:putative N-acetyl-LL-diaminopimelate aminotransferase [Bryobacteraceae bacterium]